MLENFLIEHCSPTLASLKTANLFTYSFSSINELKAHLTDKNRELNSKGIFLEILQLKETFALIFVYRKRKLEEDLQNHRTSEFLLNFGYTDFSSSSCIENLKRQFELSDQFPHEIGLFLGYPLDDVIGFIKNSGKHCKCTGCWKVYCNECESMKLFEKYKKCKCIYEKLFSLGRTITQLTVAA
ncbi:MAG: DUF3793 family protein [Oscillospiraceae bacterium]